MQKKQKKQDMHRNVAGLDKVDDGTKKCFWGRRNEKDETRGKNRRELRKRERGGNKNRKQLNRNRQNKWKLIKMKQKMREEKKKKRGESKAVSERKKEQRRLGEK